jgi:hypothetical protein
MEGYVPTQEERARVEDGFRRLEEAHNYWEAHVDKFYPQYAGQWIAMDGARIVAHAPSAAALRAKLDQMETERGHLWIRWIPPADTAFAY